MNIKSGQVGVWLLGSALGIAGTALAATSEEASSGSQLEEIVVTAQKRESTIETTPISITALSGADLQERGISDIQSVVQTVPGVSMRTSGPGQTELEMRGMTSSGGNSSTVGFYLDDIPLTAPASAQNGKVVIDPSLFDLNRIEVLRGPQGTLYGSGSMGGTIKLVPNAPDPKAFDVSSELMLGGTSGGDSLDRTFNAMVNLPLGNTAAVRVVGTLEHMSGWIDRIVAAPGAFPAPGPNGTRGDVAAAPVAADYHDVNDENLRTLRVSMLWNPTDRLSIAPSFMYQEVTQGGLSLIDSDPGTNTNYQPYNSPEPFLDRIDIGALSVKYHFDVADLTSVTSYWTRDENLQQDGTEEVADIVGESYYPSSPGGSPGHNLPTSLEDDKSKQVSEELRVTSAGNGPFKWLLGYFYQDFESDWDLWVYTPFNNGVPDASGQFIPNLFTQIQPTKLIQNSVFGEASYTVFDKLTATVGARRYAYENSVNTAVSGYFSSSVGPQNTYFSTYERNTGVTPKFDLSYQANPNLLVYTTVAQGFRPGGGNQPVPVSGPDSCLAALESEFHTNTPPLGFNPDKVLSYELGEKFRDGSGRFTLNSAGYFENWQHIQQNVPLPCGFPITGNAGAAHIYGAELEASALLAPGLVLSLNGSFSHARYVANGSPGTTIDERVQSVPDVTASGSLSYRRPITDRLAFIGRVDTDYVGSRIDVTFGPNTLPAYALTNLRAGVDGGHWSAVLFVNNAANRVALLSDSPAINVNVPEFNRTATSPPLNYGIDLTYRMGGAGH